MKEHSADAVRLRVGQPIGLRKSGMVRPLTKESLTEQQVVGLLREITPGHLVDRLGTPADFAFTYDAPDGAIEVQVEPDQGQVSATLRALFPPMPAPPMARENGADQGGLRARIDALLTRLARDKGSDLHLRTGAAPIIRIHGDLVPLEEPAISGPDVELMLRSIMPATDFVKWRAEGDADFAHEIAGEGRFRCNAGRDRLGPFGVFRLIPSSVPTVEQLGLSKEVQALCQLSKGLVLVTGPTGSGKSTTLAALVDLVNRTRADHILTIEDPIEFVHHSRKAVVTQRQVGTHTQDFKSALRAALREDPDVILVGELRDLETIAIAVETAETGHLVFGTLHTTTAASTIDRIIDQFPSDRQSQIRVMLAESLRGVIAQTLCRAKEGGRVAAYEVLLSTPAIANLIREGKTYQIPSIMQTGRKLGMVTLNDALVDLVERGLVEPKEAHFKAVDKAGLALMLKAKGHGISPAE
jgi:twitching motility protein PilT